MPHMHKVKQYRHSMQEININQNIVCMLMKCSKFNKIFLFVKAKGGAGEMAHQEESRVHFPAPTWQFTPSVVPGIQHLLLAFTDTRHAHGVPTCMQAKQSYTYQNSKSFLEKKKQVLCILHL